jgi:hypothetical protein
MVSTGPTLWPKAAIMGRPMPTGAERWRTLAVETFAAAEAMADPESKQVLLLITEVYERLAERAQAPNKPPTGR